MQNVDFLVANTLFFDVSTKTFHENQGKREENGLRPFTKIDNGPNFNYIDPKVFQEFTCRKFQFYDDLVEF